jgi:cleavage and polyadenylation specificity factor subunit 3
VSFGQNRSFITQVAPKHIILVHGQKDEMGRLKSALMSMYKQYPEVSCPAV